MEMMKVRSSKLSAKSTGYQNYFEAFIDKKSNYSLDKDEELQEGALCHTPNPERAHIPLRSFKCDVPG